MGPGGLGPQSPFAGLLTDLPAHLGSGWQSVDLAIRCLKNALRSVDFQKTPSVVAVIQSNLNTLQELLTHYTAGTQGGASTASSQPRPTASEAAEASSSSADADSQPGLGASDEA